MRALAVLALVGCAFRPGAVEVTGEGDGQRADAGEPPVDGGSDRGDGVPDAAYDAALGAWGDPILIVNLMSPSSDDDPTLSEDLLELHFASARDGDEDIFVARRGSVTEPWGAPEPVTALNTSAAETDPEISRDGLTLYFTRADDILVTRRADFAADWDPPMAVPELSSGGADYPSGPDESEARIFIQSSRSGGEGGFDLYEATWLAASGRWDVPAAVVEINTADDDRTPWLSGDGLVLFFASNRPGGLGGSADLYLASRAEKSSAFGPAVRIAELASTGDDVDPSLGAGGRYLVFMSTRTGNQELYETSR